MTVPSDRKTRIEHEQDSSQIASVERDPAWPDRVTLTSVMVTCPQCGHERQVTLTIDDPRALAEALMGEWAVDFMDHAERAREDSDA